MIVMEVIRRVIWGIGYFGDWLFEVIGYWGYLGYSAKLSVVDLSYK